MLSLTGTGTEASGEGEVNFAPGSPGSNGAPGKPAVGTNSADVPN